MNDNVFARIGSEYITSREAGALYGVTHDHISRLCRNHKIKGVLQAGVWLVEVSSLRAFFETKGYKPVLFVSVEDAARRLSLAYEEVVRLCRDGVLRAVLRDGLWQIDKDAFESYFTATTGSNFALNEEALAGEMQSVEETSPLVESYENFSHDIAET